MADKGSKVLGVYSTDAHMYTPGIKRVGGPMTEGGKPAKAARYTVTDLLPEDDQGRLKWRGDPAETYSDWTVEVVFEGPVGVAAAPAPAPDTAVSTVATTNQVIEIQTQTDTYHVHRYFLGFGTRRSVFFAKLFQEAKAGVSAIRRTKLELEPLAAKAFPDLLDFLYDPAMPLVIETQTATALHHLGVRFEMAHLQHYAKEFCAKDLSLETLEHYYQHSKLFVDEAILGLCVEFIGKNIQAISSESNFVRHATDAALWKSALAHVLIHPTNYSTDLHLSKLMAEFGVANKDQLDAATFEELTSTLRKVDPNVALELCDLDDAINPHTQELSTLQQKCATALSEIWKDLDSTERSVHSRKAAFLVDLLGKCLYEAKTENDKLIGGAKVAPSRGRGKSRADRPESTSARRPRKT